PVGQAGAGTRARARAGPRAALEVRAPAYDAAGAGRGGNRHRRGYASLDRHDTSRARRSLTVQLPAIQYGDWKTVKKRMARVVTQLKRGADLVEVMTADGMLDTESHPGMLGLHGIKQGSDPSFHCIEPWGLVC